MTSFPGTGPSTFLLRASFDDAACEAMFLANGVPRQQMEYEVIGRRALEALLEPGDQQDADKYRRDILHSDAIWNQLKVLGQPSFGQALPQFAHDMVRLNTVRADYTAVMWWAESMASTGQKLLEVRNYVGNADPASLEGDSTFNKLRSALQKHMAGVVANSGLQFGLPLGLVSLYQAAEPHAEAFGLIVSDALTKSFTSAA